MAWKVKRVGDVHGVPTQSTPVAAGTFVTQDGAAAGAVADLGLGFVIDEAPSDNPPSMTDVYGNGSILEDDTQTWTEDRPLYSDGDGTISQTNPAPGAGSEYVVVGRTMSATEFIVNIQSVEDGGAS